MANRVPETEGVIKYRLDFRQAAPPMWDGLAELEAWRAILHRLQLVGQDPRRYGGLGFGNVSRRHPAGGFVISGTQTGGLAQLTAAHYCHVYECDSAANRIVAEGLLRPSSEALTHGALYGADSTIDCVLHVHSPELWARRGVLGLPATGAGTPYGTPAMAAEVAQLLVTDARGWGIFAMAGHEDGVVAFGGSPQAAGTVLVRWLARALQGCAP